MEVGVTEEELNIIIMFKILRDHFERDWSMLYSLSMMANVMVVAAAKLPHLTIWV